MKQSPLFPPHCEWIPPDTFPDLSGASEIAIDLETRDENLETYGPGWPRKDGYIVGYAVAVDGWKGYYPVAHEGGGNLDKALVERWVKKIVELPCPKVMHNAAYDLGWLRATGFTVNGTIIDTMLAAACLDENRMSYSLNSLGFDYLKETKSEQGLRDAARDFGLHPKKELWRLPAMFVGEYAEGDAELTLKLWQCFKGLLRREEVESIFDLETQLLPVLVNMTLRGVRFDRTRAIQLSKEMADKEKTLLAEIRAMARTPVDIWAAASIARGFDNLGIAYPKTEAGAPSFTKSFLDSCEHPMAKSIIEARELNKTYGTFLQPYISMSAVDGRIHPHVNQLRSDDGGTVTGRLSMTSPNLQQVPARHEVIGPTVRGLFLPEEGELWASCDFSSQEPRLLIHYASLLNLPGVDTVVEAYNADPTTDFYQTVANAAGVPRKIAKTCIAEGQLVLTDQGLVPIEKITLAHKVWDGVEWVSHGGVAFMGIKEVITYGNLTATPDHDVWTVQSGKIPFGIAASRLDALVSTGNAKQAIRYVDGDKQGNTTSWKASIRQGAVRLWDRGLEAIRQPEEWKVFDVSSMHYAKAACGEGALGCCITRDGAFTAKGYRYLPTVQQPQGQGIPVIRRTWNSLRVFLSKKPSGVHAYGGSNRGMGEKHNRSNRQQQGLLSWKPSPGLVFWKQREPEKHRVGKLSWNECLLSTCMAFNKNRSPRLFFFSGVDNEAVKDRNERRGSYPLPEKSKQKVYDVLNAGPRHRFTVSGVLVSNCTLGMMYGMGRQKLAASLDLSSEEADVLIARFHEKVPFLRGTVDAVMRRIENPASGGAIRTLLGRKCRFPLFEPVAWGVNKALPYEQALIEYGPRIKRAMTYKGLNRLIQGSAADQTKMAMVKLNEAGFEPLLQLHDEIVVSVKTREEAEEVGRIMRTAVELSVPSVVDVEVGESWGSAK